MKLTDLFVSYKQVEPEIVENPYIDDSKHIFDTYINRLNSVKQKQQEQGLKQEGNEETVENNTSEPTTSESTNQVEPVVTDDETTSAVSEQPVISEQLTVSEQLTPEEIEIEKIIRRLFPTTEEKSIEEDSNSSEEIQEETTSQNDDWSWKLEMLRNISNTKRANDKEIEKQEEALEKINEEENNFESNEIGNDSKINDKKSGNYSEMEVPGLYSSNVPLTPEAKQAIEQEKKIKQEIPQKVIELQQKSEEYNEFKEEFDLYSKTNEITTSDRMILESIAGLESSYKQVVTNKLSGAMGYFQFIYNTAKQYTKMNPDEFMSNPQEQIGVAHKYLQDLQKMLGRFFKKNNVNPINFLNETGLTQTQIYYGMWWCPAAVLEFIKTRKDPNKIRCTNQHVNDKTTLGLIFDRAKK